MSTKLPAAVPQVPVRDRWAIIGYIRALQYAQSPEARKTLGGRDQK